jgi:subtilisin-like proprotein convertase family protein
MVPFQKSVTNAPFAIRVMAVRVLLKHDDGSELDIALFAPSGNYILLSTNNFNGATSMSLSLWDGGALAASGATGLPIPIECYIPEGSSEAWLGLPIATGVQVSSLAGFYNENPNGTWTLGIFDDTSGNAGELFGLELEFVGPDCDLDFNNDGLFPDDQDVVDFVSVLAGASCSTCDDIDFNNDGLFPDDQDLTDFLAAMAGAC